MGLCIVQRLPHGRLLCLPEQASGVAAPSQHQPSMAELHKVRAVQGRHDAVHQHQWQAAHSKRVVDHGQRGA